MSDISTTSWSETDASNNTFPPEGWPAGMFPNAVEPTARMNMGAVKRFWNRINPTYLAVLSTTDTFTVTETQTRAGYSLYEQIATRFPNSNVSTSVTVNHSGLGAILFKKWNNAGALVNPAAGDIQAQSHSYYYDGTQMVLLNPTSITLGTTNKASPTSSDSFLLNDAAAASAQKVALLSALPLSTLLSLFANKATPTSSDSVVITDAAANNVAKLGVVGALVASTNPPFTKSFTSTQQAISAGSLVTVAHSLGVQPLLIQIKLHCISADVGYSIGDEVYAPAVISDLVNNRGMTVYADSTNVNVQQGSGAGGVAIANKSGGAQSAITFTKWNIIVQAWA